MSNEQNDVTAQVLGNGASAGPQPGVTGDAATGGKNPTAQVAADSGAGQAALTPNADGTVGAGQAQGPATAGANASAAAPGAADGAAIAVDEVPLIDRISQNEAREKSDGDRIAALEGKHNELVNVVNQMAEKMNASAEAGDDDTRAIVLMLRKKMLGY